MVHACTNLFPPLYVTHTRTHTRTHTHTQEYQREQAALRAKQKEMVARKENANVLNTAKSADEFGNLRVGQLKDILAENFVDYQHCIEKSELLDKVEALWRERQTAGVSIYGRSWQRGCCFYE